MVSLDQTWRAFSKIIGLILNSELRRVPKMGGHLSATLHYPIDGVLSKTFGRLMRLISLCPHANVGWPIRCGGELTASQHCCDCGAQRTYIFQPNVQAGPWERPQLCSS